MLGAFETHETKLKYSNLTRTRYARVGLDPIPTVPRVLFLFSLFHLHLPRTAAYRFNSVGRFGFSSLFLSISPAVRLPLVVFRSCSTLRRLFPDQLNTSSSIFLSSDVRACVLAYVRIHVGSPANHYARRSCTTRHRARLLNFSFTRCERTRERSVALILFVSDVFRPILLVASGMRSRESHD